MIELRKLAMDTIYALREAGAEQAECTVTISSTEESNSLGKAVYLLREFENTNIDLTAIKGGIKSTMQINQLDEESLRAAARRCIAMAECAGEGRQWDPEQLAIGYKGSAQSSASLPVDIDKDKLYRRFEELMDNLRDEYPKIYSDAMVGLIHEKSLYLNTSGQEIQEEHHRCFCGWQGTAVEGRDCSNTCFFHLDLNPQDLDQPFIDQGSARKALEEALKLIHTQSIPGQSFVGTLILPPQMVAGYCLYIKDRIAHMKKDDGYPVPVCHPSVNIYNAISSQPYKDNASPHNAPDAKVTYVVYQGQIVPDSAKDTSEDDKSAYNVRRQKGSSVLNQHVFGMEAGHVPYAQLISGVKRGVLLGSLQGNFPGPDGDFSGAAKSSYYIEDGQIKYPLIETMISGNIYEIFGSVEAISEETELHYGSLTPWIAVSGVTIM